MSGLLCQLLQTIFTGFIQPTARQLCAAEVKICPKQILYTHSYYLLLMVPHTETYVSNLDPQSVLQAALSDYFLVSRKCSIWGFIGGHYCKIREEVCFSLKTLKRWRLEKAHVVTIILIPQKKKKKVSFWHPKAFWQWEGAKSVSFIAVGWTELNVDWIDTTKIKQESKIFGRNYKNYSKNYPTIQYGKWFH